MRLRIIHRRMRRHAGKQRGDRVWIDLSRTQPLHTLLHEVLHAKHPGWSESRVRRETTRRWKGITDRKLVRLARLLATVR